MRNIFLIAALMCMHSTAFAAGKCDGMALEVAKANLDLHAKAIDFSESYIDAVTLKQSESKNAGFSMYTVKGWIFKAEYKMRVELDAACAVQSVRITALN